MDERIPVDRETALAWVEVAQGARLANHVLRQVGDPAPGSNFAQINLLYPHEKASDWHRSYLAASLEHLLLWADVAAPLKFHPEHEVTYAFRPAYTLGRAALEASAQAVWMSAGGSANECSRRHLSLVRWDYEEHRKSVQVPAMKARVAEMDATLRERCAERFTDRDLVPPSHYSVLRWAAPEVDLEPDEIERIWRAASGAAHGKRWSALALQHLIHGPEYEPGQHRTVAIPDTVGMTEILRTAETMTFYGVLRHADFSGADVQALIDAARLWLVSVVPFRDDADPEVLAYLSRPPLSTSTPPATVADGNAISFDPVPGLEVEGYRLAPITAVEPGYEPCGDAWLLCPDGTHIDLYWRAEEPEDKAVWNPSEVEGGRGVIWVTVTGSVTVGADLEAALRLAVGVIEGAG